MTTRSRVCFSIALLTGAAGAASAQPIMWNAASGGWNTPANWNPMNVPNTLTEDAVLAGAGAYSVDLDTSPTIGSLQITNSAAMLSINAGRTLSLTQSSTNNGLVLMNPQGSASDAVLTISTNPISLLGTGELRMLTSAGNTQITSLNGGVLINGGGHTVRGVGTISATLDNQGSIIADAAVAVGGSDLTLSVGNKANSGTMSAGPGATLSIVGIGVTQTATGQIRGDGGTVQLNSCSITGGQFAGSSSYVSFAGTCVLTDVTANTTGRVNAGTTIAVAGAGLVNNAVLTLNETGSASNAILRFDQTGSLSGTGEVRLMTGSENTQLNTATNVTLTQAAGHTIRGVGQVTATLVNNGQVWGDIAARVPATPWDELTLLTNPITNNAIIGAKSGSVLAISGTSVTQNGAGQLRAEDGVVELRGAALTGGNINATGAGLYLLSSGTSTLTSVTANAPGQINPGVAMSVAGTGLTNNAVLSMNPQASASNSVLRFDATGTLAGTGEVQMRCGSDNTQLTTPAGVQITQSASHTIRGAGQIHAALINNGSIIADAGVVAGGGTDLILLSAAKTNNGIIEARPNSSLTVSGITLDQTGGGQLRSDGGTLSFVSASILGGQINTTGAGAWEVASGTNSFDAVTVNAAGSVRGGAVLVVNGGSLVNNSTITLNPTLSASNSVVVYNASGSLTGTGTMVLSAGSDNSQLNTSTGVTLTQAPGHTIVGDGRINAAAGGSFQNRGLIAPGPLGGGAGEIFVTGGFSQTDGTLQIEIAGTGGTEFDRLTGAGTYTLGGTLDVELIGGYVPVRQDHMRIIAGSSVTSRFTSVLRPSLPAGVAMRVVYLSNAVDIYFHCPPDLSTGAIPGQVGYGVPNGTLNNDDFFFYLGIFAGGDPDADLTTTAVPGSPGYGTPNGVLNNDDFFYYLSLFAGGC